MILTFKDKLTESIFHGENNPKSKKFPKGVIEIAIRKMDMLNAISDINDLKSPPGNRLEKLKGDLKEYHSIRINNQYRIIFIWGNNNCYNVSIVDYHK